MRIYVKAIIIRGKNQFVICADGAGGDETKSEGHVKSYFPIVKVSFFCQHHVAKYFLIVVIESILAHDTAIMYMECRRR